MTEAQPTEPMQPEPVTTTQPPPVYVEEEPEGMWYERIGYGLAIGGGVDDFVSDAFRDTTDVGGSWNVRLTIGTQLPVAFEASYFGSAQSIEALGLDEDAILVGNGLQGAARINILSGYAVQPFLYGGAAWRHYELTNEGFNTSDVDDSDDVFEVPVGVGIAGYISGFMADVRAEYRGVWGTDLIPSLDGADDNALIGEGDRWGVTGNIGVSF